LIFDEVTSATINGGCNGVRNALGEVSIVSALFATWWCRGRKNFARRLADTITAADDMDSRASGATSVTGKGARAATGNGKGVGRGASAAGGCTGNGRE
jgi:hypothetical protein